MLMQYPWLSRTNRFDSTINRSQLILVYPHINNGYLQIRFMPQSGYSIFSSDIDSQIREMYKQQNIIYGASHNINNMDSQLEYTIF